jgi:hypothetical protein
MRDSYSKVGRLSKKLISISAAKVGNRFLSFAYILCTMGRRIAAMDPALCGPLVSMQRIKYAMSDIFCETDFFKQVFKFTKTGRFVSWTFCILDVL